MESGDASTTKSVVDTVYAPCGCSPLGKLTQSARPHTVGGTQYWTVNTYDASGRTTRVTLPDGSHTDYIYQGNAVFVTDPAGKWKKFIMDAMGNLTIVVEPDPTLGNVYSYYTYDILNHLTNVALVRGANTQTRTFVYNSGATVGAFLLSATNPETGTVNYTYSSGLLASKTDAKGQQLTYQYDSYHRLTSVTWANNPSGSQVLRTYYYDSNPFVGGFSQYASGRLAAVQYAPFGPGANPTITLRDMYSYTQAGLPAVKRLQVNEALSWTYMGSPQGSTPSANLDVSYQYNNEGKVTSVTYPTSGSGAGATYNYSYDSMARLYSMTDASLGAVVNSATYGPANELLTFNFWPVNWATANETRTYNTLGQMTNLTVTYPTTTSTQYIYPTGSNNGKISSQKINSTGEEVQYAYDSLNRLISGITTSASDANGNTPWGQNYSYDGFGNLTAKTVSKGSAPAMSVSVNPATNRITSVYNLTYDANGNAITTPSPGGTSTLTYDAENRMISTVQMNYGYDAQNKRFWSWDGSSVDSYGNLTYYNVYMYSPSGQKLATYQVAAVVGGSPPYTGSLSTALAASDKYFGGRRIQIEDRLSSTNGKFYPYGEDKPGNPASDNWKFATYWRDSQTNLDYADQRYFSSQYGRFTTPDPYSASGGPSDPSSWNRYAYVTNDPINFIDPLGRDKCPPDTYNTCVDVTSSTDPFDAANSGKNYFSQFLLGATMSKQESANQRKMLLDTEKELGKAVANMVKDGVENDCEGLATFAEDLAWFTNYEGLGSTDFVQGFGVITGGPSILVELLAKAGLTNGLKTGSIILGTGQSSGFNGAYQDTLHPTTDQAHHFGAFLQFGYIWGAAGGNLAGHIVELENGLTNQGDVNLAKKAAEWGAMLRPGGGMNPSQLADKIRKEMCK